MPFRVAHQIVGRTVTEAIEKGIKPAEIDSKFLDEGSMEIRGKPLGIDDEMVKMALDPYEIIKTRRAIGGSSPEAVEEVIKRLRNFLKDEGFD